ncbi:MAG: hypothetical protein R3B91_21440 [Planctomycetaceae bacterium]
MCQLWNRRCILVVLLMLASVERAAIADDVTVERVQQLIQQLGDSSLSVRGEAERTLRELGPQVLSHLPAPERISSPAARDAVIRVRDVLERQQAEATAKASHVTLSGQLSLLEIVQSISEQTGNALDTSNIPGEVLQRQLNVDWSAITFWESIHRLEVETGFIARPEAKGKHLKFLPKRPDDVSRRIADAGAFRIVARSFSRRRDFTNESREILRVKFDVLAEPRLRPLFIRMTHADFELSAADHSLHPLNAEAKLERPAERGEATSLAIDFVTSKGSEVNVVDLVGQLTIELAAGEEPFVFRNLDTSKQVTRRRGGVTVTMDQTRFASTDESLPVSCWVDLRVAYDTTGPAFESHRTWVYHNEALLRSGKSDRRWFPDRFDTVAEAEAAVRLSYRFRDVTAQPSELEFVYTAPTLVISVPIDFKVSDISEQPSESNKPEE